MPRAVELMAPGQPGWLETVIGTVGLLAWATRFTQANALAQQVLARGSRPVDAQTARYPEPKVSVQRRHRACDGPPVGGPARLAKCQEAVCWRPFCPAQMRK
jgi:hypothetical protein